MIGNRIIHSAARAPQPATLTESAPQPSRCARIELRSVSKRYKRHWAVKEFDLTCAAGEVVSILGPSGCGKSTTLNLVAGLLTPDEGHVRRSATRLGYVFQEPRLIPWRTALENLLYVLDGADPALDRARAMEILEELGLGASAHSYPQQLSGGMRQRVSIGRAFVHQPELLLLDEPFSALDLELKRDLKTALTGLIERHKPAVLHVTHDPKEAAALADRIIVCQQAVDRRATELRLGVPRGHRPPELIERTAREIEITLSRRTT